jgi:hypothetical protein
MRRIIRAKFLDPSIKSNHKLKFRQLNLIFNKKIIHLTKEKGIC